MLLVHQLALSLIIAKRTPVDVLAIASVCVWGCSAVRERLHLVEAYLFAIWCTYEGKITALYTCGTASTSTSYHSLSFQGWESLRWLRANDCIVRSTPLSNLFLTQWRRMLLELLQLACASYSIQIFIIFSIKWFRQMSLTAIAYALRPSHP